MYKCMNCEKSVTQEDLKKRIRCPFCGYRIIVKNRPEIIKKVEAR
ncbi:MAG: DNA-directed RNA polymerase subunit P [Candidatus Aenigmarchaeota archaeon]|nr:DNA-directed RNA polymerase subunit P [Candidatus Aenigmarchaeota archaeon]